MLPQIDRLFAEPGVTDVVFNNFDAVLQKSQGRWSAAAPQFASEEAFADWLIDLVESAGGRLDYQNPATSVRLGDYRLHAVLGVGIAPNSSATIRKLATDETELQFSDVLSILRLHQIQAQLSGGVNVLIAGAAGSGKTSLLRHLLRQVENQRIITIEDTPELSLGTPNSVSLHSRQSNNEGVGEILLNRLVFESLRMSPDRIALGEIRGPELFTLLEALNTGHCGGGATIHANSLEAVVTRLSGIASSAGVSERTLALQVLDAFGLVVYLSADPNHRIDAVGRFILEADKLKVQRVEL